MSNLILKDQAARDRISNDLDTCLLVEAGAGSGKTASLVTRMVNLIREGRSTVSTLAAVTFTRKAASEMKGRFQLALEKSCRIEMDLEKRERLTRGIQEIDNCFIGTIHSFCALLLRERPLEAGLEPGFTEIDEREDLLLCQRIWNEYLKEVRLADPDKLESLREIGLEAQDLWYFYRDLSLYPEVQVACTEVPFPDLTLVRQKLGEFLNTAEQHIPQQPLSNKGYDELQAIIRRAIQRRDFIGLNDDLQLLQLLSVMDKDPRITQNRWHSGTTAKEVKEEYTVFRSLYIEPVLRQWREYRHYHMVPFVLPAVRRSQEVRAGDLRLNYQDLLVLTADLLKHNPEVRGYFQSRYTYLLVDEFQDTDPLQAEIMFYLAGQDVQETDWHLLVPRPGSLFVVGDPKQSIYRFRRADIDVYNEVKKLIQKNGDVVTLTTSFRSVAETGKWNNLVFSQLFPPKADSFQAGFAHLDTVRVSGKAELAGVRKITIPRIKRHARAEIVKEDAGRIAAWIRWALDGGISLARTPEEVESGLDGRPRPRDFMILLRYKADMNDYAQALEKMGLPYRMSGGGGITKSEEVRELLKLLRALLDLENPVKLVAVLRGPFFGWSDQQLWRFRRTGGEFNINAPIPETLEEKDFFTWSFYTLGTFRQFLAELPFSVALQKIVASLGILPWTATGEMGSIRASCLLQAMELIAARERSGSSSPSELVEYLETLGEDEIEEDIEIDPSQEDEIRLMNLHKAKGLQAPVVFLAHPARNVEIPPTVHIDRVSGQGHFMARKAKGEHAMEILGQPVKWEERAANETRYLEAEETRLLYVAATRARNLLVVSSYEGKPSLSPWVRLEPFLQDTLELEKVKIDAASTILGSSSGLDKKLLETARCEFFTSYSPENLDTYIVRSVKALVKTEVALHPSTVIGKGPGWGQVIHRVLEAIALNPAADLELLVTNAWAVEERNPNEKVEAYRLVEGVIGSPLWNRMMRSPRRLVEIPFSISESNPGCDPAIPDEKVTNGVIDLAFEEADGWVIVDYKTDVIDSPERLNKLVKHYSSQVNLYRRYWEAITGTKVSEAGLYFVAANEWVAV